ncbi:FG-GAP repeat domain-containing protein [Desulfolutivibrio sulfoxidireducens]|uniref:FG-GAP repeat domain-containing protein n=1 Tax=Desulfolutivibrio sulfoxidireducens TaxID=2773299 RepID=UPI00159EA788|nr:VCBS repeat-containing protein [Desulfolutivibrio sulfoxidireducens]
MIQVRLLLPLFLALALVAPASGYAQTKTFAVTQFAVHGPDKYQYLKQGIQSMVVSRLSWPGKLQAMDTAKVDAAQPTPPASEADAKALLTKLKADYIVYGSLTVTGEEASLDMHIVDASGKTWPKTLQTKLNSLVPSLEKTVKDVGAEIFQRPPTPSEAAAGKPGAPKTPAPPNASFVASQGEGGPEKSYLNPNFRYAGPTQTAGVWRSQALPHASSGLATGDVNGDGKNEIVVLGTATVEVFSHSHDQLVPLAKYDAPTNFLLLNVNVFDINGDGSAEIIVSARYVKEPRAFILELRGGKLELKARDIPLYLNVAAIPPDFSRTLVGSKPDVREVFTKGVYQVSIKGDQAVLGHKIDLPKNANALNFSFLPEKAGYRVILAEEGDHLGVYTPKGERVALTEEEYAGSGLGLEHDPLMAPMDRPRNDYLWLYYYVPLPLLVANLDTDPYYELLVSRNISVASQFFENYRAFSQGEIHALYWDGVGLGLKWKTRRIKGTVSGYALADVDNDGKPELVVCLNTWPGAIGVVNRKTVVMAYSLDTEGADTQTSDYGNIQDIN